MTLILGVRCLDALVFASDTQVSDQRTRTTAMKIRPLNDACLWAGAGPVSVIQRLEERLAAEPGLDRPLAELRPRLGRGIREVMEDILRMDYRAPYAEGDAWKVERLHGCTFAFAEYRDGVGRIYQLPTTGDGEWYSRPYALGSASDFAVALMKNHLVERLTADRATVLVVSTIEMAIATAQSGVDYPLDVWRIDASGHHQLDAGELAAVFTETVRLRQEQRELVEKWEIRRGSLTELARELPPDTIYRLGRRPRY